LATTLPLAHAVIDTALAAGKTPIVVGGTGLYLRAALADLSLEKVPPHSEESELWAPRTPAPDCDLRPSTWIAAQLYERIDAAGRGDRPPRAPPRRRAAPTPSAPPAPPARRSASTKLLAGDLELMKKRSRNYARPPAHLGAQSPEPPVDPTAPASVTARSPRGSPKLGWPGMRFEKWQALGTTM